MFAMYYNITIGSYKLAILKSVSVKKSIELLADTAIITLPGTAYNKTLNIEDKILEGDKVTIEFGYQEDKPALEFEGYVESISTDAGAIKINCEDELYHFRKDLTNKVFKEVRVMELLDYVSKEVGDYSVACDYDFKYDKFTIHNATGFDVLKKLQDETKANIYLKGKTLHLHPQYSELGEKVIYDFAINIEKADLKYKDSRQRKFMAIIEGTDAKGKVVRVEKGKPGGDKFTLKLPGVSDRKTLEARADEELKIKSYTGYEGSITGWLIPSVEPTCIAEIRDADYEYKNGIYYVVSVETTFSDKGGVRKITVGKKVE